MNANAAAVTTHHRENGPEVAAIFAAGIALLTLAVTQVATFLSPRFQTFVFDVGKAWIPGASGIGPYSGKETFMLVGWVGSWIALHLALRRRNVDVAKWFAAFLVVTLLAALLIWPPVWHLLKGE